MVPGSPWESPLRTRGMEGQSRGLYTCHPPVHIMLGVEEPALLPDALRREVGDGAEQPVHAEVMRVGQPVALGQPEVGNLEQSGEEGAGQVWLTACRARRPGCHFIIMSPQQCWGAQSPSLAVHAPSPVRITALTSTALPKQVGRPGRPGKNQA